MRVINTTWRAQEFAEAFDAAYDADRETGRWENLPRKELSAEEVARQMQKQAHHEKWGEQ